MSMLHWIWSAVALSLLAPAVAAQEAGDLDIVLTPKIGPVSGMIDALDVTISLDQAAEQPELRMAVIANNVETAATRMGDLRLSDSSGSLAFAIRDVREDDANTVRYWRPARATEGELTVRYSVTIDPERPLLALPQYELRTGPAGFSGAANAFLMLPDDEVSRDVTVTWNLHDLPPTAVAASSLGIGIGQSARPMRSSELASTYFMAGSPGLYQSEGFFGAWQGELAFPGETLMEWAAKLHDYYGGFFEHRPESFGVFGRSNPLNPGSGIGLKDSFAFTFDEQSSMADLKGLLAHEMLHAWVRSLGDTMDAANGLGSAWFGEGLAVHYQRLLPYRAGLIDREAFLRDLNETAGRYYTNGLIATPNDDIPSGFWKDTRVRVLPYDRGSLYFAAVDAQIREASGGERNLDDIVRTMLATRRAGRPMDRDLWEALLRQELGQTGIDDFHAMLAGGTVLPPSDAFGPCFARTTKMLRRFDLGFDPAVLVSESRAVSGLKPDSEAAKAGLRNGDVILNRFPQDALQGDQQARLLLRIERAGEVREIEYLPRGEQVSAYQWQEADCETSE